MEMTDRFKMDVLRSMAGDFTNMIAERDEQIKALQRLLADRNEELRICRGIIDAQNMTLATKDELISILEENKILWKQECEALRIENAIRSGQKKAQGKLPHTTMTVLKSDS